MTEQGTAGPARALRTRARVKRKKPAFVRPESWRYYRLKETWRRPRGLDHKIRRKIKGWPAAVSTGYRGPKIARGIHPSGYREVMVFNVEGLRGVDPKTQAVRISHTVGRRKRAEIIVEARRRKMRILNLKEAKEVVGKQKKETEEGKAETEEMIEPEEAEDRKTKPKNVRGRKEKQ